MSLISRPSTVIPKSRATSRSFISSLMANPCASPRAAFRKVSTTSRAWSECEAVPAATFRAKFLATTVSIVAPQTPTRSFSSPFLTGGACRAPWRRFYSSFLQPLWDRV